MIHLLLLALLLAACADDSVEIDGPGHPPCLDAGAGGGRPLMLGCDAGGD